MNDTSLVNGIIFGFAIGVELVFLSGNILFALVFGFLSSFMVSRYLSNKNKIIVDK